MYIFLAALGLVAALLFAILFFSAVSAIQETTAATAASACLLFAAIMMLAHIARILEAQKKELRQQTEYLKWMQDAAERMITGYVTSRSKASSPGAAPQKEPDRY